MNLLRHIKNIFETNSFFSSTINRLSDTKLYHYLLNQKIKEEIKDIKKNKKYNITIETSNFCNARCLMCPHYKMKRTKAFMSQKTFELIVKKIIDEKINPQVFILSGFGEPLTDSKIIDRIKYIRKFFPRTPIKFYSNFSLANDKIILQLLTSGLNEINISLNGYNASNYKKTMNLDYSRTIKNLKKLIEAREINNLSFIIRISMALISQNKKQIKKFVDKWQPLVDSISVNKVHDYNQSVELKDKKFNINFKRKTFPCKNIWNSLTFDLKGNLILCCLDYESKHKFGNIKKNSILSSFYSKEFNSIRRQHLNSKLEKIPICQHCYTPYKNGVEWLINKLY